ncbi:hypothetical protein LguiB_012824 [Lonicera macranthoides]
MGRSQIHIKVVHGYMVDVNFFLKYSAALLESEALEAWGWLWNIAVQSTSHCNWVGIRCNEAGNVTSISYSMYSDYYEVNMDELNLPSFQNLESHNLDGCGLKGTIPYEIGISTIALLSVVNPEGISGVQVIECHGALMGLANRRPRRHTVVCGVRSDTICNDLVPPQYDIVRFGLPPHDFVSGSSRTASQGVTHPRIALAAYSLNFGVLMGSEANKPPKGLVNSFLNDFDHLPSELSRIYKRTSSKKYLQNLV